MGFEEVLVALASLAGIVVILSVLFRVTAKEQVGMMNGIR